MTKIRTLVVDDEPSARARVLSFLQYQPDIEVVGECADGAQAVAAIERLAPQLVFLDVQIPIVDGFGVLRAVAPQRMPLVVFTTAHDDYALRAFEVHALDYLVKPFDAARFLRSLERARARVERQREGDLGQRLLAMVDDQAPRSADYPERLVVKSSGRVHFVRVDDIDRIESAGNYVRLHAGGIAHLFRQTITAVARRLDPGRFVRIHRCHIVNGERVAALERGNGEHVVVLRDGTRLTLSRGYRDRVQARLAGAS